MKAERGVPENRNNADHLFDSVIKPMLQASGRYFERRKAVEPSAAGVISLANSEGREYLGDKINRSDGEALVVVHPLYHDRFHVRGEKSYEHYKQKVVERIADADENSLPVIVFEEEQAMN